MGSIHELKGARGGLYLSIIGVALVFAEITAYIWRGAPWLKGQSGVIVLLLSAALLATVVWLRQQQWSHRTRSLTFFVLASAVIWIYVSVQAHAADVARNYTTFLVPLLLIMVWLKPPTFTAVARVALVLVATLAIVAIGVEIFDRLHGPAPDYRWGMWFAPLRDIGIEFRWSGPFGHPNLAGPIVALSLVFSLSLRGWLRVALAMVFGVFLIFSLSRTSILAALIGVSVLIVYSPTPLLKRFTVGQRALSLGLVAMVVTALAVFHDPTLDGRIDAYQDYLNLWTESVWTGLGQRGVEMALLNQEIVNSHAHAHNIFLDVMARHGLIGLTLLIAMLLSASWLTYRVANQHSWPLAVVATFLVLGLAESPVDVLYLRLPMFWLLLAVLAANATWSGRDLEPADSGQRLAG